MLIDITRLIGGDTLTYPGDAPARLDHTAQLARGDSYNLTSLALSAHTGTHLDAPSHFIHGAPGIDELPIELFRLPAVVIDTGDARRIEPGQLMGQGIKPGDAVLFRTANGVLPRDTFTNDFVHLTEEAARRLVELEAGLVGIDYLSVEPDGDPAVPVHKILLGAGVIILEDADLRQVVPGRYRLMCFPLRLRGTEASPCRAVLERS